MVRLVSVAEVVPIRWAVLRPGKPREAALFAEDESPEAFHLGAYRGETLVGVASLYPIPMPTGLDSDPIWQLRGMATVPAVRGHGYGMALLREALSRVGASGGSGIWCNARESAMGFYASAGFRVVSPVFQIADVGPHFRMLRLLA